MKPTPEKVLANAADTLTGKAVKFEMDLKPKTRLAAWLQQKKLSPAKAVYQISPATYGTLIRISKLLLDVEVKQTDSKGVADMAYRLAAEHGETMIRILAIAIQNTREEPSEKLVARLLDNVTPEEAVKLFGIVIGQMDLKNFISTIILTRGFNVLEKTEPGTGSGEVSPQSQRS